MSAKMRNIATALILCGCILFLGVMTVLKWDFSKLSTDQFVSNSYEIRDPYYHIQIVTDAAHISVLPAEDRLTAVDCYELSKATHQVAVKDGTLTIELQDTRKWYDHIGLHFVMPKISVYLPSGVYSNLTIKGTTGDVEIAPDFRFNNVDIAVTTGNIQCKASAKEKMNLHTTTGDIRVADVNVGALDVKITTGKVAVSSVTCVGDVSVGVCTGKVALSALRCQNLVSKGTTGNLEFTDVVATGTLTAKRTTGNIRLDGCDAGTLSIKTTTGNVSGRLLSDKVFVTHSGSGSVKVPKTTTGGRCEISTTSGNVTIK